MPTSLSLGELEQFTQWLFGDVLGWANIIQIPALVLTAAIAWLLCRPLRAWLTDWLNRVHVNHLDWLEQHRSWVIDRLIPLVTPIAWVAGLWISVSVAQQAGWPHAVAHIAINLVLAWLAIRLAADLVPNAPLAQLIAVLAWLVAALNIVHLLGPTLDLLDRAAVLIGGLRVSLLTVVKGVLSLTVLLWAATVGSALFETPNDPRLGNNAAGTRPAARGVAQDHPWRPLRVLSLASIGVDLATFALFTGALGVGVGLGLSTDRVKSLQWNCSAALIKLIKPGDVIEVGGTYGWVSALGARYVASKRATGRNF